MNATCLNPDFDIGFAIFWLVVVFPIAVLGAAYIGDWIGRKMNHTQPTNQLNP